MDDDDEQFWKRMYERDNVPDDELVARVNAAPDMGGALLVELSEFMARRAQTKHEMEQMDFNVEAHFALSDAYIADARGPLQSERGRVDCAFDSGYHALLAVLTRDERPREDPPSVDAVRLACTRLGVDVETGVRLAQQRYAADDRDGLDVVLPWAEMVRARAKQYVEIK